MKKRYIDGLTNEDSTEEERDDVLRNLFQAHRNAENREKWAGQLAEEGITRSKTVFYLRRDFLAAAAAVLVLLTAGVWWWNSTQTPLALAQQYVKEDGPLQFSSGFRGAEKSDKRRINAVAAYDAQKYEEAIKIFSTIESSDSTLRRDLLFMGLCHFYGKDYQKAIPFLTQATNDDGTFDPESGWFLALAHIYAEDERAAAPVLERLSKSNSVYAARATDLLRRIRR